MAVILMEQNYVVREVADGAEAMAFLQNELPDLVILDLAMPGINGNDLCIWIREQKLDLPIMVLSAYNEEDLKVRALDSGADDFTTKPFSTEEFLARLRALMRRAAPSDNQLTGEQIQIEGLEVDTRKRRVFVDSTDLHLTPTEYALMATLAQNRDAILTHDELLAKVWGEEYRGSSHYLHVYLGRIRKKMSDKYSALLETVAGMGYILHSAFPVKKS
jgi:DNA-binding response OmpR family regulator